jgi:1,4-dihydroxy-2-naphthoate octaprenyltransferase
MASVKTWFEAFRLRTLPLAFSCILMGGFLAISTGIFDGLILTLSLVTTLFLQVLSNLANDYGDSVSGVDSDDRQGPSRAVQAGKITLEAMKKALIICAILSLISGLLLLFISFQDAWMYALIFLFIGLGAIWAAIKYTVGKSPYGYQGLGDIFVLIFFGLVGVCGSYFLYSKSFDWVTVLPAISCGLFAVGVLNVNNIRDIASDTAAGKHSIPVRIGRSNARLYHLALIAIGWATMLVYTNLTWTGQWTHMLYGLSLPLFLINVKAVFTKEEPQQLDPYLKQLAISTLLFVLLFGAGQIL